MFSVRLILLLLICQHGFQTQVGTKQPKVEHTNQQVLIERRGEKITVPAPNGAMIFEPLQGEVYFSIHGEALYKVGLAGPPKAIYHYPSYHDPKALVSNGPWVLFVDRFYPPTAVADDSELARIRDWRKVRQFDLRSGKIRTLGSVTKLGIPVSIISDTAYFAVISKGSKIQLWRDRLDNNHGKRILVGVVQAGSISHQIVDKLGRFDTSNMRVVYHGQQSYFVMDRKRWLIRGE